MRYIFRERRLHCAACDRWQTIVSWDHQPLPPCVCGAAYERDPSVTAHAVIGDEWPGGKVFENGFPEPRRFYSRSEYHRALAERGLRVRGDGEEGSWATVSPQSLADATALVTRCS